jgi:hypothetical protein
VECVKDEEYFIKTHFRAKNPITGLSTLNIKGKQTNILNRVRGKQFIIDCIEERQIGTTTILSAHALWLALFKPSQRIVMMAGKHINAQEMRHMIKTGYAHMPDFLKFPILTDHKRSMEFDNGSWIHFINQDPTHLKGFATTCVIADTFEYYKPTNQLELRNYIDAFQLKTADLLVV